jgi:hypothetical protein
MPSHSVTTDKTRDAWKSQALGIHQGPHHREEVLSLTGDEGGMFHHAVVQNQCMRGDCTLALYVPSKSPLS